MNNVPNKFDEIPLKSFILFKLIFFNSSFLWLHSNFKNKNGRKYQPDAASLTQHSLYYIIEQVL